MTPDVPRVATDVVVVGALVMATVAAIGMRRMPDLYTQVHAAASAPFLALVPLALVQGRLGDGFLFVKALLVVAFLLLTTAVTSHVIALAAYRRDRGEAGGAVARERETT